MCRLYEYLSGRLRQLGYLHKDLSAVLELEPSQISARFNGRVPWDINEMYKLLDVCQAPPEELHIYFPRGGRPL